MGDFMDKSIKYKVLIYTLIFIMGGLFGIVFRITFTRERVLKLLTNIKNKTKRFIYNLISQFSIIIVFSIIYLFFVSINYEEDMLPNLIGTLLSVFIIDFLIKERELNGKSDLNDLLDYKIKEISTISDQMLIKYIGFENYNSGGISKDLFENIFSKQDLLTDIVEHTYITDEGEICTENVVKIDYPFYIAKELRPLVTQLISDYGKHLEHNQIVGLIELDEFLNKKIFHTKISLVEGVESTDTTKYVNSLIEVLDRLNNIVKKIKIRG